MSIASHLSSDPSPDSSRAGNPPSPASVNPLLLLPGLILLAAIGYAGKWIEAANKTFIVHHKNLPTIEYVLWAILIGLTIGNIFGAKKWFKIFAPGIATYEFWLRLGIVLLGSRFLIGELLKTGGLTLLLITIEIVFAFVLMVLFGWLFNLGPKLTALLAVGSSICGVSAIIAAEGAIDAEEKDTSYAIAAILALGALSLFSYPAIGRALHLSPKAYGIWTGLSVDNTAEATAAGGLYYVAPPDNVVLEKLTSDERKKVQLDIDKQKADALKAAVATKTARNATIGFVVLAVALFFELRTGRQFQGSKARFLWTSFPKFVLGFLLFSALASIGPRLFSAPQITSLGNLSKWAFLLTFAGVGLRTNVYELFQQGPKPFIVGAFLEIFIAVLTLALVTGVDRYHHGF